MNVVSTLRTGLRGWFQQKPNQFIARMREQAFIVALGTQALVDYMEHPNKKNAIRVRELEKQADEERRMLIEELNRSFVTPIDREDLFALSRAIDDVLDYAYSTTSEMHILNVAPTPYLCTMARLLYDCAEEIHRAMQRLEQHPGDAGDHAMRIKAIENRMDTLYAEALASLFCEPDDLKEVVNMLKLREIYRHMFHAVGSAEQAANIIGDIVIKFY
jgi:predicted phosphate transport protein (TIGR00153 family)